MQMVYIRKEMHQKIYVQDLEARSPEVCNNFSLFSFPNYFFV